MLKSLIKLAALFAFVALPGLTSAQTREVVSVQMLPGWRTEDNTQMAGVRIALAPGWKTYWRAPGEAGIPPQFSWRGSSNLKSARIYWPRPSVFKLNGMRSIGYHDEVILPVEFTPNDPSAPIRLNGEMVFGVCKDICIPASATLQGVLSGSADTIAAGRIRAALDSQPRKLRTAFRCQVEPIRDGLRLTAQATVPSQGGTEVAVVEAAYPGIWVSEAQTRREGDTLLAVADLVPPDAAPFVLDRSAVTFTVLGDHGAIELKGCVGG